MKVTLLCLLLTWESVRSYEFTDPEFNFELASLNGHDSLLHRSKRSPDEDGEEELGGPEPPVEGKPEENGPKGNKKPNFQHKRKRDRAVQKGCCGTKAFPHNFIDWRMAKNGNGTGANCFREVYEKIKNLHGDSESSDMYSCEKVKRMKKRHICLNECIAKKMELVGEDGAIDVPKAKEAMLNISEEDWQKELITKAFDTCSGIKLDKKWEEDEDGYKCNPSALQMRHCVWRELERQCPGEKQNNHPICVRLRERFDKEAKQDIA